MYKQLSKTKICEKPCRTEQEAQEMTQALGVQNLVHILNWPRDIV